MATEIQLEACNAILSLASKISVQGKFAVMASYGGNTDSFSVYAYHMPTSEAATPVAGWGSCDHIVYLGDWSLKHEFDDSLAVLRLQKIHSDLSELLDVDADGVPV